MPLQAPANYSLGLGELPDPTAEVRKHLELAMGLQQGQRQQAALGLQQQEAQQTSQLNAIKIQEAQQQQADLASLSENPTPENVARTAYRYPSLAKEVLATHSTLAKDEAPARLSLLMQMQNALYSGAPDVAIRLAEDAAQANENSNRTAEAAQLRSIANVIKTKPGNATSAIGMYLAPTMGVEKFLAAFKQFSQSPEEQRQAAANATNAENVATESGVKATVATKFGERQAQSTLDQTDAARAASTAARDLSRKEFQLRRDEFEAKKAEAERKAALAAGKLPAPEQKAYVAAAVSIPADRTKVTDLERLAKGFEDRAEKGRWLDTGAPAYLSELAKRGTGKQNDISQMRQQYMGEVNADIDAKRPAGGGVFTDKDREAAQKAYPSENGDQLLIAATVREMKARREARLRTSVVTTKWLDEVRTFDPAKKSFVIEGVKIEPGTTFQAALDAVAAAAEIKAEMARRKAGSSGR